MLVRLHDGATIDAEIHGRGPVVLLPVNPTPIEGPAADELRRWGGDPAHGRTLVDGLADRCTVVAFDYEGHVLADPKPDTLTADTICADVLAVADAAGADRFAFYGYSWTALSGLQLAARTDRITALAMGGWPPLGAPYQGMLQVTTATHAMAADPPATRAQTGNAWADAEFTMSEPQTRQFMHLYQGLQDFDERAALARIGCPRLCLMGGADTIDYVEPWGGTTIDLATPVRVHQAELERLGWEVHVLDNLDHMQTMQAATVLPMLKPFFGRALSEQTG
ncbi:alpha/beta fold hydrolase [Dactylosporangium sp. NPDC051541]|uniref:alpha/beta fold hydrolase n=1 Tax=Dactylosporangium sp. NPDC051541 TaxID=3363977 RepID=UPI0037A36FAA